MTKGQGLTVVMLCIAAGVACAQCEPGLSGAFPSGGLHGTVYTSLWWSSADRFVMAGDFDEAGGLPASFVAAYDGERWNPIGEGLSYEGLGDGFVHALAEFDVDGPGPLGPCLVAGGSFTHSGSQSIRNLAYWDGESWNELGGGANWRVWGLLVFDEDGAGPLPESLYVVGDFNEVGGVNARCAARWDGQGWTPLFETGAGTLNKLVVFDEDGPGGANPSLFASGEVFFTPVGDLHGMARYRDGVWSSMGFGPTQRGSEMVVFDPDGPGPTGEWLVATGIDAPDGSLPKGLAVWDGSSWIDEPFGPTNPFQKNRSLAVYDSDGAGPLIPGLVGPSASSETIMWRDGELVQIGFDDFYGSDVDVVPWFGGAPEQGMLVFRRNDPWLWDGAKLERLSGGQPTAEKALALPTSISPDGEPGLLLLRYGYGYGTPGVPPNWNDPVWWNGEFVPVFPGMTGATDAVLWDVPGDGTDLPRIVVAGDLKLESNGPDGDGVAYWDGTEWVVLGDLWGSSCDVLVGDPDGNGGFPNTLVVMSNARSGTIVAFDGGNFQEVGTGLFTDSGLSEIVMFDPDESDAEPPSLFVCGYMSPGQGSGQHWSIAVLEDGVWHRVGDGLLEMDEQGRGSTMCVFDKDDSGPEFAELYVANTVYQNGGNLFRVSVWNGQVWTHMPWSLDGEILNLQAIDGSPLGLDRTILYASGTFTEIDGVAARGMAWFDGSAWRPLLGTNGRAPSVAVLDDDADGPATPALYMFGRFTELGGISADGFERYGCNEPDCYADFNGDGVVDIRDFIAFLNGYVASDPRTDCDQNSVVDTRDFLCFLNTWNAGC